VAQKESISVEPATPAEATLLANLLELYIHDLSAAFQIELGPDGRFGYPKLPLYWSEPEKRFAFLIRRARRAIGFALVTRGSPATEDPDVWDVAEFFILRSYRRGGLGRRAAELLFERFPGRWMVRVSLGNRGALPFWQAVVGAYSSGRFTVRDREGTPHAWRDFSFSTRDPGA
jgi:predicted acetyltransferase